MGKQLSGLMFHISLAQIDQLTYRARLRTEKSHVITERVVRNAGFDVLESEDVLLSQSRVYGRFAAKSVILDNGLVITSV